MTVTDTTLAELMNNTRIIASVGLVPEPGRPSFQVASYQQSQGYKVIPVNPEVGSVLGHEAVSTVEDVKEPVDVVNVFTHPSQVPAITDAAIRAGAKVLWLQPGAENPEAEQKARQAGMTVISERCFMTEHQRLHSRQPQ